IRPVGDNTGENVEPTGRALGIRQGCNVTGEGQTLLERHDIDAPGLENGPTIERDPVEFQGLEPGLHGVCASWQEGCPDPISLRPGLEIEACRLDLAGRERRGCDDRTVLMKPRNGMRWENSATRRRGHGHLLA